MLAIVALLVFTLLFAVVGFLQFGQRKPFMGVLLMFCALLTLGYGVSLLRAYAAG